MILSSYSANSGRWARLKVFVKGLFRSKTNIQADIEALNLVKSSMQQIRRLIRAEQWMQLSTLCSNFDFGLQRVRQEFVRETEQAIADRYLESSEILVRALKPHEPAAAGRLEARIFSIKNARATLFNKLKTNADGSNPSGLTRQETENLLAAFPAEKREGLLHQILERQATLMYITFRAQMTMECLSWVETQSNKITIILKGAIPLLWDIVRDSNPNALPMNLADIFISRIKSGDEKFLDQLAAKLENDKGSSAVLHRLLDQMIIEMPKTRCEDGCSTLIK